jgi:hypothetical protein
LTSVRDGHVQDKVPGFCPGHSEKGFLAGI